MSSSALYFASSHEWLRLDDDGLLTVGISDYGQNLLGDIVFVDLPDLGRTYAAGEEAVILESVKAAASAHAPVAGTVVAVNETAATHPERVNQSPYDTWLFRLQPQSNVDWSTFSDQATYERLSSEAA